jgi:hypothetical protein
MLLTSACFGCPLNRIFGGIPRGAAPEAVPSVARRNASVGRIQTINRLVALAAGVVG